MKNKKQMSLRLLIILFLIVGGISCYGKNIHALTIYQSSGTLDTNGLYTTVASGSGGTGFVAVTTGTIGDLFQYNLARAFLGYNSSTAITFSLRTGSPSGTLTGCTATGTLGGYGISTNISAYPPPATVLTDVGNWTGSGSDCVLNAGTTYSITNTLQSSLNNAGYTATTEGYTDVESATQPTPTITSFTYSTTTNYANVQGYWEATTTTGISQQLNFWQTSVAFGTTNQSSYTATSTGLFNFSFFFSGVPVSNGSSTIDTSQPFTIQAQLNQVTAGTAVTTCPNGLPSDGGFNCPDTYGGSQTTLAATSTTINTYAYTGIPNTPLNLTTQNYSFTECTLTHFDLGLCAADIGIAFFVPTPGEWTGWVQNVHDDLLTRFPIGYITDFVNIVSTTTTSQLTVINATVPNNLPGGGSTINLDITGVLNPILNATTSSFNNSSASSTETLYQITSYY